MKDADKARKYIPFWLMRLSEEVGKGEISLRSGSWEKEVQLKYLRRRELSELNQSFRLQCNPSEQSCRVLRHQSPVEEETDDASYPRGRRR